MFSVVLCFAVRGWSGVVAEGESILRLEGQCSAMGVGFYVGLASMAVFVLFFMESMLRPPGLPEIQTVAFTCMHACSTHPRCICT